MVAQKYNYKNRLEGISCCQNCDYVIEFEDLDLPNISIYHCPYQPLYVDCDGYCDLYNGFFPKLTTKGE
jgi:hypothetical protein